MDLTINPEDFSAVAEEKHDESMILDTQINPLTIMTSVPPFKPVDDNLQNVLEATNTTLPQAEGSETDSSLSLNADVALPNLLVSSSNVADQQISSNTHMDNRSVAAWVESTTTESATGTLERSPSLPSNLIEATVTRGRLDSAVSTLCDQQQSIISDALTSQQVSCSNDMQRSLSVPTNDQHCCDNNELILPVNQNDDDDEEEDISTQFLPIPESEDSEVDKKTKKLPSVNEEQVKFEGRSPTSRESPKKSPNVSFHASVSFENHHKPFLFHRRRHNSWNTNKNKPPSFQRSHSHMTTTPPPSLHAQILRKQFRTAHSMPNGTSSYSADATRQSSHLSDNVFLSRSNTNSSSLRNSSIDSRFLANPSSASILSFDQNASMISDASGRSGIESTNLDASILDDERILSVNNDKLLPLRRRGTSRTSTTSSGTPSTQSLSSSSDEEMSSFTKEMNDLQIGKGKRKVCTDKRRNVLKQLMWLLEKKTTIYARSSLGHGKSTSPIKQQQQQQQKPTSNSFVEVNSTIEMFNPPFFLLVLFNISFTKCSCTS
jgi:hypothetical protein